MSRKTIIAVYDSQMQAHDAVHALHHEGFDKDQINLIASDVPVAHGEELDGDHIASTAGKGAAAGGVLGGITGLVVSLASLTVPGVGPVLAAGPIAMTTLGGAALGAIAGGILGALVGLGIPESEAHIYAESIRRGGTVVGVTVEADLVEKATAVLDRFSPVDIDERAARWRQDGWTEFDEKAEPYDHSRTEPVTTLSRSGRSRHYAEVSEPTTARSV